MYFSCCFIILQILLVIITAFVYNEEGWQEASEYLLAGLDTSVNPCDNFMKYACGKWLSGPGKELGSEIQSYQKIVNERLQEAIDSIQVHKKSTPKYKISVSAFYKLCLESNTESKKEETMIELFKTLSNLLGVPPIMATNNTKSNLGKENVWQFLGSIQRNVPVATVFFSATPLLLETACDGYVSALKFVPTNEMHDPLCAKDVIGHTEMLAALLNVKINKTEIAKKVKNMIDFEENLLQLYNTSYLSIIDHTKSEDDEGEEMQYEEENDEGEEEPTSNEDTLTVVELETTLPNISWSRYFDGLFSLSQRASMVNEKDVFIINDIPYFNDLSHLISNTDMETVFNYAFYRAMKSLYTMLLEGNSEKETNESCLEQVKQIFKPAMAKILFDYFDYDPIAWSSDIQLIAETVFSALKFLISTSDWLDAEDKLALIGKINYIKFYSGIPTWMNNDTEINSRTIQLIPGDSAMKTFFRLLQDNYDRHLGYVLGIYDSNDEADPELEVNAFYSAMHIYMLLGYSLPPWYNPSYPMAVKYALMGFTLGHELMHGFDTNMITEAPPKFANKWLKPETLKSFKVKVDCAIKQYSSYCYKSEKVCVSGRKTVSENLADIDGLKLAYMAYKFALQTIGDEPPLHGLTEFTGEQIFFLTFARTQCTNSENVASLISMDDPHAPDAARVDIPLKNFPHFAKIFNCPVGSFYAPMKTCSIWGAFYSN